MKKVLVILLLTGSYYAYATNDHPVVNQSVLKSFLQIFDNTQNVKWHIDKDFTDASFISDEVRVKARFDEKGKLLQIIRYYKEDKLPPFVKYNVTNAYKNAEIYGVTEISIENEIRYTVVMKDSKHWYYVNADSHGNAHLDKKFRKG